MVELCFILFLQLAPLVSCKTRTQISSFNKVNIAIELTELYCLNQPYEKLMSFSTLLANKGLHEQFNHGLIGLNCLFLICL